MRIYALRSGLVLVASLWLTTVACKKDSEEIFDVPTISVSPAQITAGAGAVVPITITVSAPGGLKSVVVSGNSTPLKQYPAGTKVTTDKVTYDYTVPVGNTTLTFTVTDAQNVSKSATSDPVLVAPGLPTNSMIASLSSATVRRDTLDHYDTYGYKRGLGWLLTGGSFPLSDSIIVSARGNKGVWTYNAPAPAAINGIGGGTALKLNRSNTTDWGGYLIMVFEQWATRTAAQVTAKDFTTGKTFKKEEMDALKTGDRVVAVDVFFENTDLNHPWTTIKNSTGQAGGPKTTEGMKFQLTLTNKGKFASNTQEAFISKEAYLTAPNTWQTLYFSKTDAFETGRTDDVSKQVKLTIPSDKVDRILLVPNFGYPGIDNSPIYFKNLRIVPKP